MNEMPRGIGDNNPPIELTPTELKADLLARYEADLKLAETLLADAEKAPTEINDDATQGTVLDLIKKMRGLELDLDKAWVVEEKPFKEKVDLIGATFRNPIKKLETLRIKIKAFTTAYTERKDAAEKRRLEEEAERLRLKAAEDLRKAQAAEHAKNEASRATDEFERLANAARIARAAANTEIEVAEAKVATAKAAIGKAKADMLAVAADFAGRVKDGQEVTEAEKVAKRAEYDAALTAAKADLEAAETELKTAKDAASRALQEQRDAEEKAREAARAVRAATRDVNENLGEALRSEKRADRIETRAEEPGLGQTRSEYGALSTLSREWKCRVTDVGKLPIEKLRHFVPIDVWETAARKWMFSQPPTPEARQMPGTIMEIENNGQVR